MPYVPPHLRPGNTAKPELPPTARASRPLPEGAHLAETVSEHYKLTLATQTLRGTSDPPEVKVFVTFPTLSHRTLEERSVFYTKSNLDILRDADTYIASARTFPVYASLDGGHGRHLKFWNLVRITGVTYFEPGTEGLKEMLRERWSEQQARSPESWREDLRTRWAKIAVEVVESGTDPMLAVTNDGAA